MTNTFDGLREIIANDFELPLESLKPDTPLEEIELDSLAVIELMFTVEELMFTVEDKFQVIAREQGPEFRTLGDIANYIDELIAERASAAGDDASAAGHS